MRTDPFTGPFTAGFILAQACSAVVKVGAPMPLVRGQAASAEHRLQTRSVLRIVGVLGQKVGLHVWSLRQEHVTCSCELRFHGELWGWEAKWTIAGADGRVYAETLTK